MFFSQDLLERRDSGYGLLWLAATLGAKSSFKKLPKRSVLTADISQLCGLIAEPPEPLALRLSSNLMIGVARVYKVKQEIFLADVTTCFNALKKAVQDLSTLSAAATELQMAQPSLRLEALTLIADPEAAFGLAFDSVFIEWDERIQEDEETDRGSDDEFNPNSKKPKSKSKQKQNDASSSIIPEHGRALHTLEEDHKHLLAAAFEGSLSGSGQGGAGFEASSSVIDGGFAFDDDVFALPEGAGVADIGDELARELGEGWGVPVGQFELEHHGETLGSDEPTFGLEPRQGLVDEFRFDDQEDNGAQPPHEQGSLVVDLTPFSPQGSDFQSNHANSLVAEKEEIGMRPVQRKGKRVRLLLDSRIELTDEELKKARANYVQQQGALKHEIAQKKFDKENSKRIEEMIYGAPRGVEAPVLVDFWLENFRLHVGARSGQLHLEVEGEPPRKRRRVQDSGGVETRFVELGRDGSSSRIGDFGMDMDWSMGVEDLNTNLDSRLRSSEEPGQARHASRPPSALGSHLDFDLGPTQDVISGSQRSSFFPWDYAGPSSSVGGGPFSAHGSEGISGLRPGSKRGSSIGSVRDSLLPLGGSTVLHSPLDVGLRSSQTGGEDFQFNIPEEETQEESQQSNVLTLERNSFNFLEYAKMQLRAFPSVTAELSFDDVVPKATSTRRVAAVAFYHCLVLATKDLVSVDQMEPYASLRIRVK